MALTRRHFDSLVDFCTAPFLLRENKERFHRSLQSRDGTWLSHEDSAPSWLGAPSHQVAADRVTKGWAEGANRVLDAIRDIEDAPVPTDTRRRTVRADQGDHLDIHAVYSGNLETAWTSKRRRASRGRRVVRIVAQTNLLANMNFSQLFWRGAAVVKLADVLSSAGYSVEIIAAMCTEAVDTHRNHDESFLVTFPLKNAQDPLDLEGIAGVLCNAGFHRLFGFRAYLALVNWVRRSNAGSDRTDRYNVLIRDEDFGKDGVKTFVTRYGTANTHDARAWIQECLTALETE